MNYVMKIFKIIKSSFSAFRAFMNNKKSNFEKAIKNSNRALDIDSEHCGAYWYKGTALLKLKKYSKALKNYDTALELMPKNKFFFNNEGFQIFNNIGICHRAMNQFNKAIECFNKAIRVNSGNYKAYVCKACVYSLQNNKKEAIKNLKTAIRINPNYRYTAKNESDFKNIKDMKEFEKIINC